MNLIENKVLTMADMLSMSVGYALATNNRMVINDSLAWARRDGNLAYFVVFDLNGEEIASYYEDNRGNEIESKNKDDKNQIAVQGKVIIANKSIKYGSIKYGTLVLGYSLTNAYKYIENNNENAFYIFSGLFLAAIFVVMIASNFITRYISQLIAAVRDFSENKEGKQIKINTHDEIGELADAYNSMIKNINNSMNELKSTNIELETAIKIKNRIEDELLVAKEKAETANLAKSEFLAKMSHELRTPLNAIIGFGQILEMKNDQMKEEVRLSNVQYILQAGNHLLRLINEILDLSKIESGRMDVSITKTDLKSLLEEAQVLIDPLANGKRISVKALYLNRDSVFIHADPNRLMQVILNISSNAIKYNHEDGQVEIDYIVDDEKVTISISDTGFGIPENELQNIFKPFNRLKTPDKEIEGTGIGLSITKHLIEVMGGSIEVESTLGKGSCFKIKLLEEKTMPHQKVSPELN
ncbi:MAG: ATP-binding protein [Nitrospinales bacterium]